MKRDFGPLPDGQRATLYTISRGNITATVTDLGATLVSLLVPDSRAGMPTWCWALTMWKAM